MSFTCCKSAGLNGLKVKVVFCKFSLPLGDTAFMRLEDYKFFEPRNHARIPSYSEVLTMGNVMFPWGITQTFDFLPATSKASCRASLTALAALKSKVFVT